ncbi:4Fe-4S dicluster domain-containing protein [bacterium]|nr:4Fe-4S dicluster domain-containing protein [bacterium]
MAKFKLIPSFLITRPMTYVGKLLFKKPFTMPDGDRRNKDTIYFPKDLAKKGQTILDRSPKLTLSDVFEHTPHISPNYRGLIGLNIMNCTGCKACARICPNKCIEMVVVEPQPKHWKKDRALEHPQMFIGRCSYCGFCVESCKFDALYHTPGFDGASAKKEDLFYTNNDLYDIYKLYYPKEHEKQLKEYEKEYGSSNDEKEVPSQDEDTQSED